MELELRDILLIFRKRFWLIFTITLIATAASGIISFFVLHNVYEANTTLFVGKQVDLQAGIAYQDLLMGQTLVKDYREIAKSRIIAQIVKQELQRNSGTNIDLTSIIELSDQALSNKISVNLRNDTRIIEIKVADEDPLICTLVANKVAEVFKEKAIELLKVENVQIIDRAVVPVSPIKPKKTTNVAIAFLIGLMGSMGLVFLIEYLDNTVKTPDDVLKYTELNVIGVIPKFELIEGESKVV